MFDRAWAGALDRPIRDIAKHWQVDAPSLHEEHRTARREFLAALRCVVAEDNPGPPEQVEAERERLLDHLGWENAEFPP